MVRVPQVRRPRPGTTDAARRVLGARLRSRAIY